MTQNSGKNWSTGWDMVDHSTNIYSNKIVNHSNKTVEHSNKIVNHSNKIVNHSNKIAEHSNNIVDLSTNDPSNIRKKLTFLRTKLYVPSKKNLNLRF